MMVGPRSRAASTMALALALGLAACAVDGPSVTSSEPGLHSTASPAGPAPDASRTPTISESVTAGSSAVARTPARTPDPTPSDAVSRLRSTRVFFGHQSVGFNVMRGINLLSSSSSAERPDYVNLAKGEPLSEEGFFAHSKIGRNGQPDEKLEDFAAILRDGLANQVEVAVMKFCYLDVRSDTDVAAVFQQYRSTFRKLEKEFPKVTFVYATVPLQTRRPADNAARARFNTLIRREYADTGRLWDIAKAESTQPDGTRVRGSYGGMRYDALYPGFTEDGGHLNERGATVAAEPLVELIAGAS